MRPNAHAAFTVVNMPVHVVLDRMMYPIKKHAEMPGSHRNTNAPVSPPDNFFALPAEVFSSCFAIVSAVMVGGLFLWPALRYGTGYHSVRSGHQQRLL